MLSYDSITAVVLLQDEESAVLVDVSLCIEAKTSGEWVRERKGLVTVIGHLESSSVSSHFKPFNYTFSCVLFVDTTADP